MGQWGEKRSFSEDGVTVRAIPHCNTGSAFGPLGPQAVIDDLIPIFYERSMRAQRAAIAAMREPTEGQVVDGFEAMKGDWKMCRDAANDAKACWRAMIEAALAD
jgi:hypothetical protein